MVGNRIAQQQIRAEPRQEAAAAKKASGTKAEFIYLQVKGTKTRSPMVAYSVCTTKGQSSLSPLHPFLCDSWIIDPGTEQGPFSSPETIHCGWRERW